MKSWREQGFVPDSDDEDEFESQGSKKQEKDLYRNTQQDAAATITSNDHRKIDIHDNNDDDDEEDVLQGEEGQDVPASMELDSNSGDEEGMLLALDTRQSKPESIATDEREELPESMEVDSVDGSQEIERDNHQQEEPQLSQIPVHEEDQSTQDEDEIAADASADVELPDAPTPRPLRPLVARPADRSFGTFNIPSSPDELQLEPQRPLTPPPAERRNEPGIRSALFSDDEDISPLSSPPSSLNSVDMSPEQNGGQREPENPANRPEDLLPPLDIPEEIMRELSQPARRSLRQRNPIQLHPYLLEDARYQSLMKARGVKPVRLPNVSQQRPNETDESQEQDSLEIPEPPSSSDPGAEFHLPPSSPVDPYERLPARSHSHTPRPANYRTSPLSVPVSHRKYTYSAKRRKISHGGGQTSSNLEVVISNNSSERDDHSIFDPPPSPPRSGSLSSTHTVRATSGFRFPRGFTPPTLDTPITETRSNLRDDTEESPLETRDPNEEEGTAEPGDLSDFERTSAGEEEPEDETAEVKRLQKKIRGVLPASWLRLDLKQQEEQQRKSRERQRNHDLSRRLQNAKGVARKIIKPRNDAGTSSSRPSFPSFRDEDTGSDDNSPVETDSRKVLAGLVGFDNPFDDMQNDDDIPEDNRIDYMFPSTSSRHGSSTARTYSKRDKSKKHAEHHETKQRPPLRRQTRITDSMSKHRKGKGVRRASRKPPKLGILDAPDVVQRPRQDQPQFLRVAARQARSRRDHGRRSPTRKIFRLSTRRDTEDANNSLQDWRKGSIRQTKITHTTNRRQSRQPLIDLSLNEHDASNRAGSDIPVLDDQGTETHRERVDAGNSLSETEVNEGASTAAGWARREGATKKSSATERHHDKWVIPRKFAVSSLKRQDPRPAEFESVETSRTAITPSLFQQSLSALNRTYRHAHTPRRLKPSLTLDRFLSTTHPPAATLKSAPTEKTIVPEASRQRSHVQRQARKRRPKRIDTYTAEHQQPPALTLDDLDAVSMTSADHLKTSTPINKGLGVLKPAYSVDFNITPLQPGTYFHDSTFIGSGSFSRSLDVQVRNLDKEAGHYFVQINEGNYRWSAWNDAVSSELGLVFDIIMDEMEKDNAAAQDGETTARRRKVQQLYRSVVEYATEKLWFLDPVDRTAFVDRCVDLISKLNDQITTFVPASPGGRRSCLFAASFNVVFANQVLQIASHDLTSRSTTDRARALLTETLKQATALVFNQQGLGEIRSFLEDNRVHERREIGIRDDYPVIDAYVILRHVLDSKLSSKENLEVASATGYLLPYSMETGGVKDVTSLEQVWRSIFTTLPLDEIDQFGIYQVGARFRRSRANWSAVRSLMLEVLDQYDCESEKQPVCLNNYCRVLFHRCFYLLNSWGWRDCKLILDTLFDFFAKNTLHNLKNEESFGSPSFLDELETGPALEVLPGDPCFHIFLKIVGSGLRFMSQIHEKKRIRNFAWRLLPNHGRVYPKDKPLHHEDLDALRNHHDLLCTLFWAVPDGCRPRLETIRNLVDPTNSHRETCSISLRSWDRLVRFKLSTNEDVTALGQFAEWHAYFVTELVKQHALARTEVEAEGHAADMRFSRQIVESTISQNQKQIESLLSTALSGMNKALGVAPSLEHARILISSLPLQRLFGLFNPKRSRVNKIVSEALEILVNYTRKDDSLVSPLVTASANEDSQEYGDWAGIEEICADGSDQPDPAVEHVDSTFHPAVSRLLSNCFGEDYSPEDAILLDVVDCWTAIAQMLVKHRLRHWDSYVSPYGGDSWATLRSTVQTRKFTPYFLAKCIERDSDFYVECTHQVLGMWLSSLVERSSMLKFQHYLTEVLLNQAPENPLLNNLPFSKSGRNDRYYISLEEFSERRISLLSSLLSNMREHLQLLEDTGDRELSTTREHYRELIESLMTSMKANYQELGSSTGAAQGSYVAFVHSVVGFLQQHALGICPVDRFFTEPTSFPLPATDPTYIVARLKSYGLRLSTGKAAKPLVVFIQSVSERAALDGQQAYLVDQLYMSMGDVYESGNPSRPTLRAFLLRSVFPAYIESAFSDVCGWILAAPVLQAVSRTFADMLLYIDTADTDCVSSVTEILCTVFESSYRAMHLLVDHAGMIEEPTVLVTATNFLDMITSALLVIDYIDRTTGSGELLIRQLEVFRQIALFVATCLLDPGMAVDPDSLDGRFDISSARHSRSIATPRIFHEARAFATRELQSTLRTNWSRHEGKYFTRRGQQLQEVQIDPLQGAESTEMAKTKFVDAIEIFFGTMSHLGIFSEDDRSA